MTLTRSATSRRKLIKSLQGDYALDNWHEHRADRETFTLFVGSDPRQALNSEDEAGVEHHMADRLELNLSLLSNISPTRPILIIMGTCGGGWEAGMQMFGALLCCPNPITILGIRHSRSMSSIIPLAADRFLMRPPTEFMIHYGTWEFSGLAGEQAQTNFESLRAANEMMLRVYTGRLKEQGIWSRKHQSWIRHMLEDQMRRKVDLYLSTDDAVKWGFADGVCIGQPERAAKRNIKRRNAMLAVLRKPIQRLVA